MKKIYLLLSVFVVIFTSCETDFDVNSNWEEVTVVYGLLDSGEGEQIQQIKISKGFLGEMDALDMAQYADSINFDEGELAVKVIRIQNNGITDTISLNEVLTLRDPGIFYDSIMMYTFINDNFLNSNSEYELLIKNNITGNQVSSKTNIVSNFDFDNVFRNNKAFQFGFYNNGDYSVSTITWDDSNDNGKIYQLDLVINYTENSEVKELVFSQDLIDDSDSKISIEGERFFNFLREEITKDNSKERYFNNIDLVMTVGSEDLDTYIKVNEPNRSIVQQRPKFTNIDNGIGLFSSRYTKIRYGFPLTSSSIDFLKSIDGLDRNFK